MKEISLYPHQKTALNKLRNGSILVGGVGSGKSITSIAYYFEKVCGGKMNTPDGAFSEMTAPLDLYIITTARKRDELDWDKEASNFGIVREDPKNSLNNVTLVIDSWNNIGKYTKIKNSFFIFDEQRIVGYGAWVKAFLKIANNNKWVLLSATPGDRWIDFLPVFIANGYFRNKTDFTSKHVVYNPFTPYPSIQRYVNTEPLERYRKEIAVPMPYRRHTTRHHKVIFTEHDSALMNRVVKERWDVYREEPIENASQLCYVARRVSNSDPSRVEAVKRILEAHDRVVIFYNFNYELKILRDLSEELGINKKEWNGHLHEPVPTSKKWMYLVQYTSGSEGWNCVETNAMIFYSLNYAYRTMDQAAGRIDRLNTPHKDLYYYRLQSNSDIDKSIGKAVSTKKNFNVRLFAKNIG